MEILDYVRSGALAIGLLVCMYAGKDTWLLADTIVWGGIGASLYFFPKPMLEHQTDGTLDKFHMFITQWLGAIYLAIAVMSYYTRRSRNPAVHTNQMVARALAGVNVLQCIAYDYLKAAGDKQRWNAHVLSYAMLGCILMTIGNFYYAFKSASYGGGVANLRNRLNVHMFIDIVFLAMIGLGRYAFPEMALSQVEGLKADGIHAHLIRMEGCLCVMGVLLGLNSLTFPDDDDKRIYLFGRLVGFGLAIPIFVLYQWKYAIVATATHRTIWIMVLVVGGNLLLGYLPPLDMAKAKRK